MEEKMAFDELQQMVSICLDEIIQLKQEKEQLQQKNQGLAVNGTINRRTETGDFQCESVF